MKRRPSSDQNFAASVYDGRDRIGCIVQRGDKFVAFDIRDREIGAFATIVKASRAVPEIKTETQRLPRRHRET